MSDVQYDLTLAVLSHDELRRWFVTIVNGLMAAYEAGEPTEMLIGRLNDIRVEQERRRLEASNE